jgi:transposase-like protein
MHGNETRIEFCRLAAEGMPYVEIAQKLEISLTSLYRWRNDFRIKARKRGRKNARK